MKTTGRVARKWACAAIGVWVASEVVGPLQLGGTGTERAAAVVVVAVVFTAVVLLVPMPLGRMLRRAAVLNQRRMTEEPDRDTSDSKLFELMRRHFIYVGLGMALSTVVLTVAGPAALGAGVELGAELGLDAELGGGLKDLVTVGLVVAAVETVLLLVLALPVKRRRPEAMRSLAGYLLCLAGLALAALWLDGVEAAGTSWLTLAVVAALFHLRFALNLTVPVPGMASLVLVSANALVLWLIVWLTGLLHIDGFWPLVGTVALMWVAEWPSRLADAAAENRTSPPPPPDPLWPDHHMPQSPLY
ncbi:phage holin family protein [Streptomyces uncialis]|uniref:phage holin family protein n=1 Tax=Streptomyces uncialis TaxID=1048205 RepID=UPI000A6CF00F|nr:phage holin family protein [Streptomyces uncialis]